MKRALLAGLLYGIGAGCACYLGYLFGRQETELEYERALGRAAINVLTKESEKNKEKCQADEASQE